MKHLLAAGSASASLRWMCKCGFRHNLWLHKVACMTKLSRQTVGDRGTFSHGMWHFLPPLFDVFALIVAACAFI